jgi:hypothetical protein
MNKNWRGGKFVSMSGSCLGHCRGEFSITDSCVHTVIVPYVSATYAAATYAAATAKLKTSSFRRDPCVFSGTIQNQRA